MPNLICKCCNKSYDEIKIISCSVCKDNYYYQCVELTSADLRSISSKKGLTWSCQECSSISNDVTDLKSLVVALKREVDKLKSLNSSSSSSIEFEDVVNEVSARNYRKNNLLVFGVPEETSDVKATVNSIMNCLEPSLTEDITPIRIGKVNPVKNLPRPIKIRFQNYETVFKCLSKSKNLKSNDNFKLIRISSDKTPRQQEYFRKIKEELNIKLAAGEKNLRIKYINGIPRIVNSNSLN